MSSAKQRQFDEVHESIVKLQSAHGRLFPKCETLRLELNSLVERLEEGRKRNDAGTILDAEEKLRELRPRILQFAKLVESSLRELKDEFEHARAARQKVVRASYDAISGEINRLNGALDSAKAQLAKEATSIEPAMHRLAEQTKTFDDQARWLRENKERLVSRVLGS